MAQISVNINNRKYEIACDDGQEAHLKRLSEYVDKRMGELVAAVGQVGESRLLVMAALLLADELSDAYDQIEDLKKENSSPSKMNRLEEELGGFLETLAGRLEAVAEGLESK